MITDAIVPGMNIPKASKGICAFRRRIQSMNAKKLVICATYLNSKDISGILSILKISLQWYLEKCKLFITSIFVCFEHCGTLDKIMLDLQTLGDTFRWVFFAILCVFWRKFASMCFICGGEKFFTMTCTQNLMQMPERQYNSTSLSGEFFFNFPFVHSWANFKVRHFALKNSIFLAIFKFTNFSGVSYALDWLQNLIAEWKFNVLSGSGIIKSWMQLFIAVLLISCRGANFFIFDPNTFDQFSCERQQSENSEKPFML